MNSRDYLKQVEQDASKIAVVPDRLITSKMCVIPVTQGGSLLKNVPERFKTEEVCQIAVQQDGLSLFHVPEELKTQEVCLAAVTNRGIALRYVPERLKTEELCIVAVQQAGWTLELVPESLKTERICLAAVQQDGTALEGVPECLRTKELCLAAVKESGWALQFVPQQLRTHEMNMTAVGQSGLALQFVPEDQRTQLLCRMALYGKFYSKQEQEEIKQYITVPLLKELPDRLYQTVLTREQKQTLEKGGEIRMSGIKSPIDERLIDLIVSFDKRVGCFHVSSVDLHGTLPEQKKAPAAKKETTEPLTPPNKSALAAIKRVPTKTNRRIKP